VRKPTLGVRLLGVGWLFFLASSSGASTMGFTRHFHFPPGTEPNLHWISLPWSYQPEDVGTLGALDAEDLCEDLGEAGSIASILRWDEPTSTFIEYPCGTENPFLLNQAEGYGVRGSPGQTVQGFVVGVHEDSFAYSISPSGGSQLSWLSIPYHMKVPEKHGDLTINAEDLCRQIGLAEVLAIVRWDDAADVFESYACGSELETPFEILRGESYGVVNRSGQTIQWHPIHY